jgi:hypothetical protein
VVVGASPQPPHIRILSRKQGFFITLPGASPSRGRIAFSACGDYIRRSWAHSARIHGAAGGRIRWTPNSSRRLRLCSGSSSCSHEPARCSAGRVDTRHCAASQSHPHSYLLEGHHDRGCNRHRDAGSDEPNSFWLGQCCETAQATRQVCPHDEDGPLEWQGETGLCLDTRNRGSAWRVKTLALPEKSCYSFLWND